MLFTKLYEVLLVGLLPSSGFQTLSQICHPIINTIVWFYPITVNFPLYFPLREILSLDSPGDSRRNMADLIIACMSAQSTMMC